MPRVLVVEPDAEIRELFSNMLTRLGHDPLAADPDRGTLPDCDVVLLEPAWELGTALVRSLLRDRPSLPVVAASIFPPHRLAEVDVTPVSHLTKPFTLVQLSEAIAGAFTRRPTPVP